jgi:hypothetical protein
MFRDNWGEHMVAGVDEVRIWIAQGGAPMSFLPGEVEFSTVCDD